MYGVGHHWIYATAITEAIDDKKFNIKVRSRTTSYKFFVLTAGLYPALSFIKSMPSVLSFPCLKSSHISKNLRRFFSSLTSCDRSTVYEKRHQKRFFSKDMRDEYGEMTAEGQTFTKRNFALENQTVLPEAKLRYQTYGKLNDIL